MPRCAFVAVGTPQVADGYAADLRYVDAAIDSLLPHLAPGDLVAGKSTSTRSGPRHGWPGSSSRPGRAARLEPGVPARGFALQDTLHPDRLVYGVRPGDGESVAALDEVYAAALAEDTLGS